ncbi:MAG: glycosyl hydrolase family 65 protein [Chloroflexota bacterium]
MHNAWHISEETPFNPAQNALYETLLALGNGYLGMRGTFVEGVGPEVQTVEGTYLNGFFESKTINYGEKFIGYPDEGQSMIQVMNGKRIDLQIDTAVFQMGRSNISDYQRRLNMKTGVLERSLIWQLAPKNRIKIESSRLILYAIPNLALIQYTVTPLDEDVACKITSWIDNQAQSRPTDTVLDPRLGHGLGEQPLKTITQEDLASVLYQAGETNRSKLAVACGVWNEWNAHPEEMAVLQNDNQIGKQATFHAKRNQPLILTKFVAYEDSRSVAKDNLFRTVNIILKTAVHKGYTALVEEQSKVLNRFWQLTDVQIKGNIRYQKGLRFNMLHLYQSTGRNGKTNIGAKGLTGEGYEGHYFWDTEIYILSYFTFVEPDIAKQLLKFRYHTLNGAQQRAREMSISKGALFPWRTITGQELSAYFPGSTAQYHINADIAYAVQRYWLATGDADFMRNYGVELLVETARVWLEVGHFDQNERFRIDGVTGPDEYTALVNNNAYTNLMAANHLRFAQEMLLWLQTQYSEDYGRLKSKLQLPDELAQETAVWEKAAANMLIPYDETLGVIGQDDTFLQKAIWDFDNTPPEMYPLLLHYHPLVIYRYQVTKQADLLLAHFLLNDQYPIDQKQRDFNYYEPITTHDSSLSMCIFGILAAEFGQLDKALQYFGDSIVTDLENTKGNSKDGIHAANMAGSWMSIVFGFGGMRLSQKKGLSFKPVCPPDWDGYQFQIWYQRRLIQLKVTHQRQEAVLIEGEPLDIWLNDKQIRLSKGA